MKQLEGQADLFELDDAPAKPLPPFTVWTCVWAEQRCGWCGGKGFQGGGACRNPRDENESFFYQYCKKCDDRYGDPRVTDLSRQIIINRTQADPPKGWVRPS